MSNCAMDRSASRTTLTCAGVIACAATFGLVVAGRGDRAEPLLLAPDVVEPASAGHIDPTTGHEDLAPFAGLFVVGASWTLPCFDERVDAATATGDRRYEVLEVRTVAGVELVHISELGWYAMTDAGLHELGAGDSSLYYAVDRDPTADPDVPPHVTRHFFEQPRRGAFDASDAALLKRRPPMIASPPRDTTRFEPGAHDQHELDEDPSYQPDGDGCGRASSVFPYGGGWCVQTAISCGGGAHYTFLCFAQGRGVIGVGAGQFEGTYAGERCGDTPM